MAEEYTSRNNSVDAAILRGQKQKALSNKNDSSDEQWGEGLDRKMEENWDISEEINNARKLFSKKEALKWGIKMGFHLRSKITETRFDGASFFTVLTISIIKDFSDFATGGLASYITTWIITPIIFLVFFMRKGNFIKRLAMKRFIFAPIVELIPFINIFPTYTLLTIMLKLRMNKKVTKLKEDIRVLDEQMLTI
ncbi:MAG: hypothetical protein PF572_05205 [Patescibacteria group bacterium]|jgi:hypothetical protein|nr:hypothetical protein [Patescibacteria group bacterium]